MTELLVTFIVTADVARLRYKEGGGGRVKDYSIYFRVDNKSDLYFDILRFFSEDVYINVKE